jgi:LacI family transcriptional regulator
MHNRKIARELVSRPRVLYVPCFRHQRTLDGVCRFACEANWIVDLRYHYLNVLPNTWDGDGILCFLLAAPDLPDVRDFMRRHAHIPTVDLANNDKSLALPRVLQDNVRIGRMGADHLLSRGYRNLGFLMFEHTASHDARYAGFLQEAREHGCPVQLIQSSVPPFDAMAGAGWLTEYLKRVEKPFGLMVASDFMGQLAVQACHDAHLCIPGDVGVLGVDSCPDLCELCSVAISSIDNNTYQQGYEGARLLHRLMQGKKPPAKPILVPPGVIHVRASTDIMAIGHQPVVDALRYIDAHYQESDLAVEAVAAGVAMSKRGLHDAFVKFVGCSVREEITHRRLQQALRMVQGTDEKLWNIAEACGFGSAEVMSRLFQRKYGYAPSYYRFRQGSGG